MSTPAWVGPMVLTTRSHIPQLLMLPTEPHIPVTPNPACRTTQDSRVQTRRSSDINNNLPKYQTASIQLQVPPIHTISIRLGLPGPSSPLPSPSIPTKSLRLPTETTLMEALAHPSMSHLFWKAETKWKDLSLWMMKGHPKMLKLKVLITVTTTWSQITQKGLLGWASNLKWKPAIY